MEMTQRSAVARPQVSNLVLTAAALLIGTSAFAQSPVGPRPLPPPSYGPPPSPAMIGYQSSQFSPQGFAFTLEVALADVQGFLPAGYTAIASTPGATTATVTGIVASQNMLTLTTATGEFAAGTYGPYDSFGLVVPALTPPGSLRPFEVVSLGRFVNNSEIVDLHNALTGAGSTQLADITVRILEQDGAVRIKANVRDFDFGLRVDASVTTPAEVASQVRNQGPLPGRSVNALTSPPMPAAGGLTTVSSDSAARSAPEAFTFSGAIKLSGGKLKVQAANPGTAYWNNEVYNKLD
jgi:hypothetical protein